MAWRFAIRKSAIRADAGNLEGTAAALTALRRLAGLLAIPWSWLPPNRGIWNARSALGTRRRSTRREWCSRRRHGFILRFYLGADRYSWIVRGSPLATRSGSFTEKGDSISSGPTPRCDHDLPFVALHT